MSNGKELGLGFWKKAEEIIALARTGRGIVMMPTGTGKTTQTPQALHEAGFTKDGIIYISVPKRILAVELATRVAEEMGVRLGDLVGYQIRGESRTSRQTRILFMTEGTLRGKIRINPMLKGVSMVLFDEFHQRTLLSDFNVALIERAQAEGATVGFLLMSATIDPAYLSEHFQCGVVDGSNLDTTYPIKEEYIGEVLENQLPEKIAEQVARLAFACNGNGLVFCDGKAMIDQIIEAVAKKKLEGITVLPLHGDLDGEARHAPFAQRSGVTVTVATDIVETGATLPGIGWVVDSGLAKEVGYDPVSDISSLRSRPVAQDRLKQRRGRCGREMAGTYVGMFSLENKLARPARTEPEILRVPLREVVLTIKSLGLSREGKPIRLVDSPAKANWKQAKSQLQMLGLVAKDEEAAITPLGEKAVELGCDPREAAMLLKAAEIGCLGEMAIAIAASQGKRLLFVPKDPEKEIQALSAHYKFKSSSTCDAWTAIQVVKAAENRGQQSIGAWCRDNFVSYRALKELWLVSRQFLSSMSGLGFQPNTVPGTEEQLCQAIAAGLPDRKFIPKGKGWYYREGERLEEALLGRDSIVRAGDNPILAWEVIEITTKRGGKIRLITNAAIAK